MFGIGPYPSSLISTILRRVISYRGNHASLWTRRTYFNTTKYSTELEAHVARPEGIPMYRILDERGQVINTKEVPIVSRNHSLSTIHWSFSSLRS